MVNPAKVQSNPKHVRSMGARTRLCEELENSRIRNGKFCAKSHMITKVLVKKCTYMWLFLRTKNLKWSQKKILQGIKKWSRRLRNKYVSTRRDSSCKSQKSQRNWISPDTSSQRQVKTGNRISKINSNLNNQIISKPVKSKGLKKSQYYKKLFWIIG